jgi:hypothetical protein
MKQKNGEQDHDGRALKQRRHASKEMLSEEVEQDALEREEGGGREGSAGEDGESVRKQMDCGVGALRNQRQEDQAESACAEQYQAEKDGERKHSCEKEMPVRDRLNGENKDIHEVWEEKIPLVDRSRAHDDEGVHDIEVVVAGLGPEGAMHRVGRKGMVGGKEKERHQKTRDSDGAADQHDAPGLVVLGGEQLIVKEAVKEVAYKDLELTLLSLGRGGLGLYAERENRISGRREKAELSKHGEPP